jgi:hypothetical protein
VNPRNLLSLLAMFALATMPFGHMRASAQGGAVAAAGHCHGSPTAPGKADRAAIDCAIACAVIAPSGPATADRLPVATSGPDQAVLPAFSGTRPEADPPPPRIA